MDIVTVGAFGLGAAALVQTWLVWRATRTIARVAAIEARVEKFGDALTLLTDTTESAFRAVATEMSRQPVRPATAGAVSAARTRRIARAASKGASVAQIAATEDVAEGEVRLRLQLASDQATRQTRTPAAKPAAAPKKARTNGRKREVARGAVRVG
jgi:hypothetical protein